MCMGQVTSQTSPCTGTARHYTSSDKNISLNVLKTRVQTHDEKILVDSFIV